MFGGARSLRILERDDVFNSYIQTSCRSSFMYLSTHLGRRPKRAVVTLVIRAWAWAWAWLEFLIPAQAD